MPLPLQLLLYCRRNCQHMGHRCGRVCLQDVQAVVCASLAPLHKLRKRGCCRGPSAACVQERGGQQDTWSGRVRQEWVRCGSSMGETDVLRKDGGTARLVMVTQSVSTQSMPGSNIWEASATTPVWV